jgi:hypothetical protein
MGKSTISMAIFNSYVTNYQRVPHFTNKNGGFTTKHRGFTNENAGLTHKTCGFYQ